MFKSPFTSSTSKPGQGKITLSILSPCTPVLSELCYQYPLKLVAPDPVPPRSLSQSGSNTLNINGKKESHSSSVGSAHDPHPPPLVHTIFLLTYGGGIVAGDTVDLHIRLSPDTRLNLLTQGSTKIFKTPDPLLISHQHMEVDLHPGAALLYLPDPVQPFRESAFVQKNVVRFVGYGDDGGYNLCICDWVSGGRGARGENWDFWSYESRNEIWGVPSSTPDDEKAGKKKRLLLRDNLLLHPSVLPAHQSQPYTIYATLILHGPLFSPLANHFLDEFTLLPRLGSRNWDSDQIPPELSVKEKRRKERQEKEKRDGLIWSAAKVRDGFTLVKLACPGEAGVESARSWLKDMILEEGSVVESFGERGVMCL
ncbi:hypothetical protein GQ43DRAFT_436798, partial [Delitschia confertaspora ATCC 74209]